MTYLCVVSHAMSCHVLSCLFLPLSFLFFAFVFVLSCLTLQRLCLCKASVDSWAEEKRKSWEEGGKMKEKYPTKENLEEWIAKQSKKTKVESIIFCSFVSISVFFCLCLHLCCYFYLSVSVIFIHVFIIRTPHSQCVPNHKYTLTLKSVRAMMQKRQEES